MICNFCPLLQKKSRLHESGFDLLDIHSDLFVCDFGRCFHDRAQGAGNLAVLSDNHAHIVFVNGKETVSSSYTPKEGDRISVRGHGRFIYKSFDSTSRKGKLNAVVEVYV